VPKYSKILLATKADGVKGMRIGILKEGISSKIIDKGVRSKFMAAASIFRELGATVEEISVPMHNIAPAIFGAASRQGGALGRAGKASGRRQVMLTDLYEKMLPCTAEKMDKVSEITDSSQSCYKIPDML
jgi:amidase